MNTKLYTDAKHLKTSLNRGVVKFVVPLFSNKVPFSVNIGWWSNSKKTDTDKQTAGWNDRQILFHRILRATAWDLTRTTAIDWHLKVKYIEYNIGLTKNYCITVSTQKINSIHTLILKIQQILKSHDLINGRS